MRQLSDCSPTALAAIQICESLILTLIAKGIIRRAEALDLMNTVVETTAEAGNGMVNAQVNRDAAMITSYLVRSIEAAEETDSLFR